MLDGMTEHGTVPSRGIDGCFRGHAWRIPFPVRASRLKLSTSRGTIRAWRRVATA